MAKQPDQGEPANRVIKHLELKATSQKEENLFLGMITIIEITCEDPMALEEIVTEIDLADWLLVNEGVAFRT